MKRAVHFIILVAMVLFMGASCSDSESRVPYYLKTAKVIINLGLPAEHASAGTSIIDRVLRFFASDAVAQSAPATFSSIFVRVTGPGMGPIEKTFAASSSISFEVPAGNLRQFEVIAYVAPGDPSAAASFRGTGAASLPAGSTVSIIVAMSLYETKLVVQDTYNTRIVQINNFGDADPANWEEANVSTIGTGFSGGYSPQDIDFDSRGRIYVANNDPASPVFRLNNIHSTTDDGSLTIFGSFSGIMCNAIAIDRTRELIYAANYSQIFTSKLDGGEVYQIIITDPNIMNIRGIDVEPVSGDLFLACDYGSTTPSVVRLSISGPPPSLIGATVAHQSLGGSSTSSNDVIVKGAYVYVAQSTFSLQSPDNRIIRFDLGLVATYAVAPYLYVNPAITPPMENDHFYGPRRFVAITNRRICIMDEDFHSGSILDRLVGFNDIGGSGWTTLGGGGAFKFYIC